MREFPKPVVVVSKCLGFDHCRYNGDIIPDDFIAKLGPYVEYRPVCAEMEIGLGVPRQPINVVAVDEEERLVQPATGRDVSAEMRAFAAQFLASLPAVDGFILKSRSPSCGLKDVKLRAANGKGIVGMTSGFFGRAVIERFPHAAIEDEGRLTSFRLRQHFLTKLFTLAAWREVKGAHSMGRLVQFHATNKLLLMAYNQKEMRLLGRIVANLEQRPLDAVLADYEAHLAEALRAAPRCTSATNALMHGLGYFSEALTPEERRFSLDVLQQYRTGKLPLVVPLNLMQSYGIRFPREYLDQQTFFHPYPEALVELTDSGKEMACLEEAQRQRKAAAA